jgi:hypothetical protein
MTEEELELENNFAHIGSDEEDESAASSAASSYKGEFGGSTNPLRSHDEEKKVRSPTAASGPTGDLIIKKLKLTDFGPNFADEVILNASLKKMPVAPASPTDNNVAAKKSGDSIPDEELSPSKKRIRWSDLNQDENEQLKQSQNQVVQKFKVLDTDLFSVLPDEPPKMEEDDLGAVEQVTEEDLDQLMDDFLVEEEELNNTLIGGDKAAAVLSEFNPILDGVDFPKLKSCALKEFEKDEEEHEPEEEVPEPPKEELAPPKVSTEESLYASFDNSGPSSPGMQMVMAALTFQLERKSSEDETAVSAGTGGGRNFAHNPYAEDNSGAGGISAVILDEEADGVFSDDSADESGDKPQLVVQTSPSPKAAGPKTPSPKVTTPKSPSTLIAGRRASDHMLSPTSPKPKVLGAERVTPASTPATSAKLDSHQDHHHVPEFNLDASTHEPVAQKAQIQVPAVQASHSEQVSSRTILDKIQEKPKEQLLQAPEVKQEAHHRKGSDVYTFDVPSVSPPIQTLSPVIEVKSPPPPVQSLASHQTSPEPLWNDKGQFIDVPKPDDIAGLVTSADLLAINLPDQFLAAAASSSPPIPEAEVQDEETFVQQQLQEEEEEDEEEEEIPKVVEEVKQQSLIDVRLTGTQEQIRKPSSEVNQRPPQPSFAAISSSAGNLRKSTDPEARASGYVVRQEPAQPQLRHFSTAEEKGEHKRGFLEMCLPCLFPTNPTQDQRVPLLRD